jgi:hypothetical protein
MESVLNDFANDTDADLAAYVQIYQTRIADRSNEIEEMRRGPIDEVVESIADNLAIRLRDAIARLKEKQEEERERLERIKDEQKRRAAEAKG